MHKKGIVMIEGIKEIGEKILSEAPEKFLESLVLNVQSEKDGGKQYIVIIEFDTAKDTINFDFEEIKEETSKKYLWIDVAKGNKPQIYLTTASFKYPFTKTLSAIKEYKYPYKDKDVDKFLEIVVKLSQKFFNNKRHINIKQFVINGGFLVEKIASGLYNALTLANRKLKMSQNKTQKKEILKNLLGKNSNLKKYLPDEIFKNFKQRLKELLERNSTLDTVINVDKSVLENSITEKFTKDIEKMPKIKNKDQEKKLSIIKALIDEKLPRYEDIGLVSLRIIDDDYKGNLIDHPGYRKIIEYEKIEQIFDEKSRIKEYREKVFNGICSLCGKKTIVSSNTTNLKFKFYMTDKIGFSQELRGDFLNNYNLCKECYKAVMAGEVFIINNLGTNLAGMTLYIIPKFIFDTTMSINKLKKMAEYIQISFKSAANYEGLKKFQEDLEEYIEFEGQKNNFILNFLFYKELQNEFKVLKLIKDVPPSRLDILREKEIEIHDLAVKLLGKNNRWYLNLDRIYYLFPVRISKGEVVDHKKILEFYDCLFSVKPISYQFLIKQFIELVQVYRFKKIKVYNVTKNIEKPEDLSEKEWDIKLVYSIIEINLLLLYLRKLNLLKGGNTMGREINTLLVPEDIKKYCKEMGYSEEQIALFLLGYLIGEIGNEQWSKENPNKPILNKIVYQGMNPGKILRLTNEIFEKLKQWRKLQYNERIFGEMKKLLDKHIQDWTLSDQENVFYVLSGYAYNTYLALTSHQKEVKEKGGTDEQQ